MVVFFPEGVPGWPGTPSEKKTAIWGGKTKKNWTKFFLRLGDTHKKYILQKNWTKTVNPALSSGPNILQPVIWGHHHQLDDHHRNPNINERYHLVGQPTSLEAAGDQEVGGESHRWDLLPSLNLTSKVKVKISAQFWFAFCLFLIWSVQHRFYLEKQLSQSCVELQFPRWPQSWARLLADADNYRNI